MFLDGEDPTLTWRKKIPTRQEITCDGLQMRSA
jgi:hypothetical protein